jgi:hypothetical protein
MLHSIEELENEIRRYIKFWYEAEYIGLLTVDRILTEDLEANKLNTYYKLTIGLPSYMAPTTMAIDCESDEEFLDYVFSELRSRNYMRLDIYKVTRTNDSREE